MLLSRIATALILAPLFVLGLFGLPHGGFAVFIGVFLLLSSWEWGRALRFRWSRARGVWTLALALLDAGSGSPRRAPGRPPDLSWPGLDV
jgi:hypothetical protein